MGGHAPFAVLWLWALVLAVPNAFAIALRSHGGGLGQRLLHHVLDAGQMLALGLLVAALAWVWMRFVDRRMKQRYDRRRRMLVALAMLAILSWFVGSLSLPESLDGLAERAADVLPFGAVLWASVILASSSLPLAALAGAWLAETKFWPAAPLTALAAASANNFVLDRDYYGLHLFVVLNAFVLGAACLSRRAGWGWKQMRRKVPRAAGWLSSPRVALTLSLLAAFAGGASLILPTNKMLLRLSLLEGAPLARTTASLRRLFVKDGDAALLISSMAPERRQWFERRDQVPQIPPSDTLLPDPPIVILLTVDCLRGDLLDNKRLKKRLPYFRSFAASAVDFRNARATSAGTVPSLTSVFSGKHYSQLYWAKGSGAHVWPRKDPSVRFPELLSEAGVTTLTVASKHWLTNRWGVVRGFSEERDLDKNRKPRSNHVKSDELLPKLQEQLLRHADGAVFAYAHIMDPHAPYNYGKKRKGKPFYRYVSEVERLGTHLSAFDDWLKQHELFERTTVIITADHGEAFGEHDTWQHSKTLYEELIRVPLWFRIPGVEPRRVAHAVSLIDLGPTLLDLFAQQTPGEYMGQSLVPLLRGEHAKLTRPIAAEARLLQALVHPNGIKAIYDARQGTEELYDLNEDRKERNNLADGGESRELRLLHAFFRSQLHSSYEEHPPYRP